MKFTLRPTRRQAEATEIVSDLDRLVASPVAFKWNGKAHFIKPMELDVFLNTMNNMQKFSSMITDASKGAISFDEAVNDIHELVSSCCDTITKEDIRKMTLSQVNALVSLIIKTVTGEANVEKKNTVTTASQNKTIQ